MTLRRKAEALLIVAQLEEQKMTITRKDRITIMDGMVVEYVSERFEVSASRNGVLIGDHNRIKNKEQLDDLVAGINRAFLQYMKLSKHGATLSEREIDRSIYGDNYHDEIRTQTD